MPKLLSLVRSLPLFTFLHARLANTPLAMKFAKGTLWMLIGKASWRLLSVISTVSIARIFGPQVFGEYNMVRSTVDTLATYAGLRLGVTSTKYVAEYQDTQPVKAARILRLALFASSIVCGLTTIILFASAEFLAERALKRPDLTIALSIGAFLVFFQIYGNVKQRALAGFENFKELAKISVCQGLVTPLACIPAAYLWGVEGAIGGLVVVAVITYVYASISLARACSRARFPKKIPLRDVKDELPILWKFALPGFLVGLVIAAMMWVGRLLLTQQESGYAALGLFGAAYMWQAMVVFLPTNLGHVILPYLSKTHGSQSKKEFKSAVSIQVQASCMIASPLIILVIGSSGILSAIFGERFAGTEDVIPVLMLSVFFFTMNHAVRQVYDSTGRRWTNLAMYMVWAVVYLVSCIQFIPEFGAIGLAVSHVIAEAVLFFIQAFYVDLILIPAALRKHFPLIIFTSLLVYCSYLAHDAISGYWFVMVTGGLLVLSSLPILAKLRGG